MEPLNHGLIYQTDIPVSELTGWLEDNCHGDWAVEVDQPDKDPLEMDPSEYLQKGHAQSPAKW